MKKNIALMVGGYSGEYEISVLSSQQINDSIDKDRFNVYPIIVTEDRMFYEDETGNKYDIDKNDFSLHINGEKVDFALAFNMIHGSPGEDGKLQGYFDLIGMPYTGCNMFSSSVTFNKYYCKLIASAVGLHTSDTVFLTDNDYDIDSIIEKVGLPCFVKPNKNGSSIGITKVYEKEHLGQAIDKAFEADDEVLVENFIEGREMACGIYTLNGVTHILPITEIISKNDFFDYEAKYTGTKNEEITPADIEEETAIALSAYTNLLYKTINCKGLVRVDFIITKDNITFLELNTTPGMSSSSIVPAQIREYGLDFKQLINSLIDEVLDKK